MASERQELVSRVQLPILLVISSRWRGESCDCGMQILTTELPASGVSKSYDNATRPTDEAFGGAVMTM